MATERATLPAFPRNEFGSRITRRLRRDGKVPGVVYSDGSDATTFQVESRDVRVILVAGQALFDLKIEGSDPVPVVIKEQQHHPVRGDLQHLDLQKVRLDVKIEAEVLTVLEGEEDSPGIKQGGVLEHVTREVLVEALPADIPDSISLDVSGMEMHDVLTLEDLIAPDNVELISDDPAELTIVTLSPPRVEEEPETDVEADPELVGEEGAEGAEEGEGGEADDSDGGDGGDSSDEG